MVWIVPSVFRDFALFDSNPTSKLIVAFLVVARPYFSGILVLLALISLVRRKFAQRDLDRARSLEELQKIPWKDFENMIAEAYRRQGYGVEENLGGGADGGIDLTLRRGSEKVLVQCKQWKSGKPVPVERIREMFGLLKADASATGAVFITTSRYTPEASRFAAGKQMTLIDGPKLLEMLHTVQATDRSEVGSIETAPSQAMASARVEIADASACPKCGQPMLRRTAKRGVNAGSDFWGCSTYPKCSGTRAMAEAKAER